MLETVRDICVKFGITNVTQSLDIGQNSEEVFPSFWISGQFLLKENCHNSRTSDNIDMKLGPVTEIDKRNKTTFKNIGDDFDPNKILSIITFSHFFNTVFRLIKYH